MASELEGHPSLDAWQAKFVHAMNVLVRRWEYSDKQADKIIEIYDKIF